MSSDRSVVVVGAGAAGLMAARELVRAGCEVVVLEAGSRVGGRVLTVDPSPAGVPIELGAEFVHGEAPLTQRLLAEARLATVPVLGRRYLSEGGRLEARDDMWKRMDRVFDRIPDRGPDRSFQEFLDEEPGGRRLAEQREAARGFVQGYYGADPARISARSLAAEGDPTEGAARSARIVQGYGALVEHLHREVAGHVRLGALVSRIRWAGAGTRPRGGAGVRVETRDGAEHRADAAVVTVPLPALQGGRLAFEPEIPALRRSARQLVMGHVARVTLVVRRRFWETDAEDLSFLQTPGRPFNVWWTPYPLIAPVVVGWSGGPPALELTRSGELEASALRELARAFGMRRDRLARLVESVHGYDWSNDPLVRGAYSYVGVGGSGASKRLARPVGDTLFFAGEATDEKNLGTVEAALASGERAARRVLRALK